MTRAEKPAAAVMKAARGGKRILEYRRRGIPSIERGIMAEAAAAR